VLTQMGIPPKGTALYIEMYKAINTGVLAPLELPSPENFAADISPEKAAFMAISQVPISTDSFTHKVTNPAWKNKPTWYMVASGDRSINPEQERMMAKRANAKTVEVNASHVAYMSQAKETASLIEEAATSAPVHGPSG
jgi:hypothetical protein